MTPEEAQTIIKANMKDMAKIVQDAIGVLHPELAESEDERIRKRLITLIRVLDSLFFTGNNPSKEQCIAYLEKQKEQKPEDRFEEAREKYQVEWSEEDERMLKSAIWHISNSLTNGKNTDCKCDLTEWFKEKLKSLRPVSKDSLQSWKPCEEQIHAIIEALKYLPNNKDEWMILNTLVDVFKKLM